MSTKNDNSILLLDDDPAFRQTVTSLLTRIKLSVIQAGSREEATNLVAEGQPALAIVDYNLPDGDGMTWISEIRAAGHTMPIVFVSANFCEAKTFNLLRNILKVSLVLQKPIAPELFLQQLDGILPFSSIAEKEDSPANALTLTGKQAKTDNLAGSLNVVRKEYDKVLKEFPQAKNELDAVINKESGASEPWLLTRLKQTAQKLRLQSTLIAAKNDYAAQLPGLWQELCTDVAAWRKDMNNGHLKMQAINDAHKIKGSGGSFGFIELGLTAGQIEEALKAVSVCPESGRDSIWKQISAAQSLGENLLKNLSYAPENKKPENQPVKEFSLLLLTTDSTLRQAITSMPTMQSYQFYYADSATDALLLTKTISLAGLIIDLRSGLDKNYFQLCKELRQLPGNGSLPFIAIAGKEQTENDDQLAYLGFSSVISTGLTSSPINEAVLLKAVDQLLKVRQLTSPRVLIVDDEPSLCKFIDSVLQSEGMVCESLNEPIEILEKMEYFQPDIVILDVMMPGLSGFDVCRLLRSKAAWQDLIIFFLTGRQDNQGRMAAFVAGGDDFLTKPVLGEELIVRVKNHLERTRVKQHRMQSEDLTGWPMRKGYLSDLGKTLALGSAKGEFGSLCMLEIDRFDQIAEQNGLPAQDHVIEELGSLLQCRFKGEVKRCRFNDKMFLLTFPGYDLKLTSRLIEMFSREFTANNSQQKQGPAFNVTLTYALAEFPKEVKNVSNALELLYDRLSTKLREKIATGSRA